MVMNSHDSDSLETQEWLDSLESVLQNAGSKRAHFLLEQLLYRARKSGINLPYELNSPYKNTLNSNQETPYPGDREIEKRNDALIRWVAIAMVVKASQVPPGDLGGHIASYASASTLYNVGFDHCFRASSDEHGGDLVFIQGHSAPGIYAREFLQGRLSEEQVNLFRQEVEKNGLPSYPHPWLMGDFWQFPTVSMGLGPIQGIYQARFLKYLHNRGIANTENRKVWVFCGDGEMDEVESLGALGLAAREQLDNLIFVVNCNLQRLDGPVRGNTKIIQELERIFHGAGWNVLKVIWGDRWDPLLANDKDDLLLKRMEEAVDGDYQNYKAHGGAYVREHFFGKYPELLERVTHLSDDDIADLNRGGHDPHKVYSAYKAAMDHKGQPTVILAKTIKGYGLGDAGEAQNIAHNIKKVKPDELVAFRNRFNIPVSEEEAANATFYRPSDDSPEVQYLKERRKALGGDLPARREKTDEVLNVPALSAFDSLLKGSGERKISSTMAFVRIISTLLKDKAIGDRIVPIVPDESRTFGMEGLFRQVGIYSPLGQRYTPVDANQVMSYREAMDGQILQEGLNEAGAFCSWIAAATSYSVSNRVMIPFYIYYSMFGFQRIGDLAWAAGDSKARGFLLGGISGRSTMPGEGLQHQDGHSHVLANTIPNCVTYDPTFSCELAVIIQDGLKRMVENQENIFYYITVMVENYQHPEMPKGVEEGIVKGLYRFKEVKAKTKKGENALNAQLLSCGGILLEAIKAADILANDYGVNTTLWSATSFNELTRDAMAVERYNRLQSNQNPQKAYVTQCLEKQTGPVIAATDYMRSYADQIRAYIPQNYIVLGTDGFGRSDTREALRHFFEVDHRYIVQATLTALAQDGDLSWEVVKKATKALKLNPNKPDPKTV